MNLKQALKKRKIKFYEKSHIYKVKKRKFTSVTTFTHNFFEPFKAKEIARKLSKFPQNRVSKKGVRYFLKEWKQAAQHGTLVHKEIEDYILTQKQVEVNSKSTQGIHYLIKFLDGLKDPVIHTEVQVYCDEGIAGTVDVVVEHLVKGKRVCSVLDWKTNKRISKVGYMGKKGIHPLTTSLEDSHIVKYGIQLSFYGWILEKYYDCKVVDLRIVHLREKSVTEYMLDFDKKLINKMVKINGKENDKKGNRSNTKSETKKV